MEFIISVHVGYNIDHLCSDIEAASPKLKLVKPHDKKYCLRATTHSHMLAKMVVMEFAHMGVTFDFRTIG